MSERSERDESRISLLDESRFADSTASFGRKSCKSCLIAGTIILILGFGVGFGLYYGLKEKTESCALGCYTSDSKLGIYNKYAISTDSEPCAGVGK